jgi:hypothetical protein
VVERNAKGHFVKGQSGNKSGRPKKVKLTDESREEWKDDPKKALVWLMNNSESKEELFKHAKAVIDYVSPKLSAVKQQVQQESLIQIQWMDNCIDTIDMSAAEQTLLEEYTDVVKEASKILEDNKPKKKQPVKKKK